MVIYNQLSLACRRLEHGGSNYEESLYGESRVTRRRLSHRRDLITPPRRLELSDILNQFYLIVSIVVRHFVSKIR